MSSFPVLTLCEKCTHPGRSCISYYPDAKLGLILLSGVRSNFPNNWFENWGFACDHFDFFKTFLMEQGPFTGKVIAADHLQQARESTNIWHKMCQIFHKTKELKNLIMVFWDGPISDFCHFVRVGVHPMSVNFAAKDI